VAQVKVQAGDRVQLLLHKAQLQPYKLDDGHENIPNLVIDKYKPYPHYEMSVISVATDVYDNNRRKQTTCIILLLRKKFVSFLDNFAAWQIIATIIVTASGCT